MFQERIFTFATQAKNSLSGADYLYNVFLFHCLTKST